MFVFDFQPPESGSGSLDQQAIGARRQGQGTRLEIRHRSAFHQLACRAVVDTNLVARAQREETLAPLFGQDADNRAAQALETADRLEAEAVVRRADGEQLADAAVPIAGQQGDTAHQHGHIGNGGIRGLHDLISRQLRQAVTMHASAAITEIYPALIATDRHRRR